MLFNSYPFIFIFLPVVLILFFYLKSRQLSIYWLVITSFFFYAWWNFLYLPLLFVSIVFNYSAGQFLRYLGQQNLLIYQKIVLYCGVSINLFLLGYFKYFNFFVHNINVFFNSGFKIPSIILPLAISFFTFQQIAFLVDSCKPEFYACNCNFIYYCLFVSFFPQLIAGPIIRHTETIPQYKNKTFNYFSYSNISIGMTIFLIGLFKKVVLADGIAPYSTSVFDAACRGETIYFILAWCGSLSYTFQLYFDFSGYSDMAIGLARIFNVALPVNFYSPYRCTNIIDFWKQWHITLSLFLRDYLYIPLGGNRKGYAIKYFNLMITMLLGGFWHGAGWKFIIWGGIHGFYLCINHLWRDSGINQCKYILKHSCLYTCFCFVLTFCSINAAWIFFRSDTLAAANEIMRGVIGLNGLNLHPEFFQNDLTYNRLIQLIFLLFQPDLLSDCISMMAWLMILSFITWGGPNTYEILKDYKPALHISKFLNKRYSYIPFRWRPSIMWAFMMASIFTISLLFLSSASEFLYFNF